jgi:hypothetical protein
MLPGLLGDVINLTPLTLYNVNMCARSWSQPACTMMPLTFLSSYKPI